MHTLIDTKNIIHVIYRTSLISIDSTYSKGFVGAKQAPVLLCVIPEEGHLVNGVFWMDGYIFFTMLKD